MIICTFLFLQGVAGQSIFPFRHFVQHQSGKTFIFHVQRPPSRYKNFGIGSQNCLLWCPRWWQFHRKHCKVVYAQGKASHKTKWQRRQPRKLVYSQENFQLRRRSQKGVRNVTNKTCLCRKIVPLSYYWLSHASWQETYQDTSLFKSQKNGEIFKIYS